MSAVMSHSVADYTSTSLRSIDELDAAIRRLVRHMNTECYQMLVLVRELDDRFGWKQWGFKTCAEWLAWRSEIGLSAAREQVRTAHALRSLPAISAAFAEGRLTYTKVRALTRVADLRQEDLLLAYALETTAENVEERCRHAQRRAGVGSSRTACMVESVVDDVARPEARHDAAHGRSADRRRRAHCAGDRLCCRGG